MFAVEIPGADHAESRAVLSRVTEWNRPRGRDYFMADVRSDRSRLLNGCKRAFFLKIEPGGRIHEHTDTAAEAFDTDLLVVETNDRSAVYWRDSQGEHSTQLELGKRYRVIGRNLVHWAVNDGDTDRVHLLIEYPKF